MYKIANRYTQRINFKTFTLLVDEIKIISDEDYEFDKAHIDHCNKIGLIKLTKLSETKVITNKPVTDEVQTTKRTRKKKGN